MQVPGFERPVANPPRATTRAAAPSKASQELADMRATLDAMQANLALLVDAARANGLMPPATNGHLTLVPQPEPEGEASTTEQE